MEDKQKLEHLRHSAAHLLAAAVLELFPKAKRTIGPAIESGFYYDFDFGDTQITEEDLPKIEAKMAELLPSWTEFTHREVTAEEAKEIFKDNPYKIELIEEFSGEGQTLTMYKVGEFEDLCRGGHSENPSKELGAFKLLNLAGAYWRGNEKNPMLTRIYGTAFPTQQELDQYLEMLEEAKKRDHKKLGPQLELFFFSEFSPGMPYWLPKGVIILNELINFWREEHSERGYQEIVSPILNKKDLYITSGHYDHYWADMFKAETNEKELYGVKAMNCPNAMVVFGFKKRSYKELPLKLSDTDPLHRDELSGTLNGLLRVRQFRQDDAHVFVSENQIKDEYKKIFEIVERFYSIFNLEYSFRLGTRPEEFMGDLDTWNRAEDTLREILEESGKDYFIEEGDGAFYGPKVDILMKDALGRSWQMGTVQLDFQQPRNFRLTYTDSDGSEKTPIAIHRVIYGSLERFIGIITEHFAGAFPTWLSPTQAMIVPISDKNNEYAQKVLEQLKAAGVRVEVDERAETMQAKIRDAQMQKIPYMLVVGAKEEEGQTVAIRSRKGENLGVVPVKEFVDKISAEIQSKSLNSGN